MTTTRRTPAALSAGLRYLIRRYRPRLLRLTMALGLAVLLFTAAGILWGPWVPVVAVMLVATAIAAAALSG